jgi:hypothetical protein
VQQLEGILLRHEGPFGVLCPKIPASGANELPLLLDAILVEDVLGDDVTQFAFGPNDNGGASEDTELAIRVANGPPLSHLSYQVENDLAIRSNASRGPDRLHARQGYRIALEFRITVKGKAKLLKIMRATKHGAEGLGLRAQFVRARGAGRISPEFELREIQLFNRFYRQLGALPS